MIHLTLLIGQLTCAVTRSLVHHRWRHDLRVTALASLVQEEVDQCTLQSGALTDVHRESGTSNLHAQIKVDEVVFLGEFPVGQGIGDTQLGVHIPVAYGVLCGALLQVALHYAIILGGLALGHLVVRNVRNLAQQCGHLLLSLGHHLVHLLRFLLQLSHLSLYLLGLFLLTLLHQGTNLTRQLLLFIQTLVELLLGLAALFVYCEHVIDGSLSLGEVLLLQATNHAFGFLINKFEC